MEWKRKEECRSPETELKDVTVSHLQPVNYLQIKTRPQCKTKSRAWIVVF